MKRLGILFTCCLTLFMTWALMPHAVRAQDPSVEGEYVPLIFGDNIFSLLYPSKWTFDSRYVDNNAFVFTSDAAILTRPGTQPYAPGEITVWLSLLFAENQVSSDSELDAMLMGFLDYIGANQALSLDRSIASPMPQIEGQPTITRATVSAPDFFDGGFYLWTINERLLGLVFVQTSSGEIPLQEPDVLTLIQSVQFNSTIEDLADAVQQIGGGS